MLAGSDGSGADSPAGEGPPIRDSADFVTVILDNLRKAGVQNTFKNERLVFERIEPYAGTYVQAVGEYTNAAGKTLHAAISIGPEYGTVDAEWVKEAAKEARKGEGFPMLVVCAFAFDPYVGEEAKQWPNLYILITRMNPDLAMDTADQKLLKKTGAGNLFMVFGEPDLELRTLPDGKLQVELHGLDVYDPTTGEIRSPRPTTSPAGSSTPTTTRKASSCATPTSPAPTSPTTSCSAPSGPRSTKPPGQPSTAPPAARSSAPSTGKIAVKVINHYGDEVLKVYAVPRESGLVRSGLLPEGVTPSILPPVRQAGNRPLLLGVRGATDGAAAG